MIQAHGCLELAFGFHHALAFDKHTAQSNVTAGKTRVKLHSASRGPSRRFERVRVLPSLYIRPNVSARLAWAAAKSGSSWMASSNAARARSSFPVRRSGTGIPAPADTPRGH